jgi:hypothetical protein
MLWSRTRREETNEKLEEKMARHPQETSAVQGIGEISGSHSRRPKDATI